MTEPKFVLNTHYFGRATAPDSFAIEMTPRADTWPNFYAAIPLRHRGHVLPSRIVLASSGTAPWPDPHHIGDDGWISEDGEWWLTLAQGAATTLVSAYYYCRRLPQAIAFGPTDGEQHRALLMAQTGGPPPDLPRLPERLRRKRSEP